MRKERAPEASGWVLARRFTDAPSALESYEAARDLLLEEDLDASAFRFYLSGESYVAVLGEAPLSAEAAWKVGQALRSGQEAGQLPTFVLERLRSRRRDFKGLGIEFLERRGGLLPGRPSGRKRHG